MEYGQGPNAKSLRLKSEATEVPMHVIDKVFKRGLAAWHSGHRPGTSPIKWAYARVHSFVLKGKTYHTSDRDLSRLIEKTKNVWFYKFEFQIFSASVRNSGMVRNRRDLRLPKIWEYKLSYLMEMFSSELCLQLFSQYSTQQLQLQHARSIHNPSF